MHTVVSKLHHNYLTYLYFVTADDIIKHVLIIIQNTVRI